MTFYKIFAIINVGIRKEVNILSKYYFKSFVYVMKFFPPNGKYYYKVGISNNPQRRRKELKRQYKVDRVEIIWSSPNLAESTARRVENELLNRISQKHEMIRKECFYAEEPLEMIVKIRKEYFVTESSETIEVDI